MLFIFIFHLEYKSLIIRDFEGNANEYIDASKDNENHYQCKRFFCNFCLKGSYDTLSDDIKNKNDWLCPYCSGQCFCTRCTRNDKLLKLIAFYISIKGDINILYDALIVKNRILDILHKNMVISNILIIVNDQNSNPEKMMKGIMNPGKEEKNLKDIIDKYYDLKDNLISLKEYFNKLFIQSKVDKSLLYYEKEGCKFKNDFIGKKRNFDLENQSVNEENESLNKNDDLKFKNKSSKIYLTRSMLNK